MKLIKKPNNEEFPANEPMLANLLPDDGLLLEHLFANQCVAVIVERQF